MRHFCAIVTCAVLAIALTGCSDATKKTFGLEANPPDAFDVGTQAPLSLPPELGQLPPPNPGQPRPQQVDAAQSGADAIDPGNAITPAPRAAATPGEQALLAQAGPTPPAGIRAAVNQDALVASKPPGFVAKLMGTAPATAPTVDAGAEQQRLQENEALGQPVTDGATPQTTNQSPGLMTRFLNIF
ncbi:MAG: DUF3035 domain-containing protein [Acidocella sp.]|nr:DUF3035 domain-containing protein [Acidocella sp.]